MKVLELDKIKNIIFSDEKYKNWMVQISEIESEFALSSPFNNQIALDHGIKHMSRVADNVYSMILEYNNDLEVATLGYIAALIHDIGIIKGKKNHAKNGSMMVEDFLKKFDLLSSEEISKIIKAVAVHGDGENGDIIGIFLAIADKVDLCMERSLGDNSPIKEIDCYNIKIHDSVLEINYTMKSDSGRDSFYMIPKSIDVPVRLANKLNLNIRFIINGIETDFSDREHYKGMVYGKVDMKNIISYN